MSDQDLLIDLFGPKIGWFLRGVDVVDGDLALGQVATEVVQQDV